MVNSYNSFRENLNFEDYHFYPEVPSYDGNFIQRGYSDIRVRVVKKIQAFKTTKADYIIECKRLDGGLPLNREYLKEGIMN